MTQVLKSTQSWHIQNNTTAETILHWLYTGSNPTVADLQGLAADVQAAAVVEFKPLMATQNAVGLVTLLDLNSNTGNEGSGGSVTAGTLATLENPASTCVVMNHAIAPRYRGGKPRSYCPFGTANQLNTSGTWTAAHVTNCNTAWANFISSVLTSTVGGIEITEFVSVSYYKDKALRVTPAINPISQSLARTRVGTQRRRNKTA